MKNSIIIIILFLLCEVRNELPEKFEYTCKDKNNFIHVQWNKENRVFLEDTYDIYISQLDSPFLLFANGIFEYWIQGCLTWIDILYYSTFVIKLKTNEECKKKPIEFEFTPIGRNLKRLYLNVTNISACHENHYYSKEIPAIVVPVPKYIGRGQNILIQMDTYTNHTIEAADRRKKVFDGISFSNGGVRLKCTEKNSGKLLDIYIRRMLGMFRLYEQEWKQISIEYKAQITLPVNSDDFLWMDLEQILLIKDSNFKSRIETKKEVTVTKINFKYGNVNKDCNYFTTTEAKIRSIALEVSPLEFCGMKLNVFIAYKISYWTTLYLNLQFENKCKYSLIEFYKKNVALNMNHKNGKMSIQIVNNAPKTIILLLKFTTNHHTAYDVRIIHSTSSDVTLCLCTNMVEYNPVVCNITDSMHIFELEVFGSLNGKESSLIWTLEAKPSGTIPTIK